MKKENAMLPLFEYPVIWAIIFGAGLIALLCLSRLVKTAARSLTEREKDFSARLDTALIIWPVLAIAYARIIGLDFTSFIPVLAIPLLLGTIVMFRQAATNILQNISLYLLVALGTYRVAGYVFIYAYYQHDLLSYGFAFNAGWGDVLTGVLAPLVAFLVYVRSPGAFLAVIVWTFIGIGDLILAPTSANLYGAQRLVDFPLNLVPLFLGPPFGILLHLITLRAAWLQRARYSPNAKSATAT